MGPNRRSLSLPATSSEWPLVLALGVLRYLVGGAALLGLGLMIRDAWPALVAPEVHRTWFESYWLPGEGHFGILALLSTSLMAACLGTLVAVPIAFGSAIALSFYLPQAVTRIATSCLEAIAAIPTVLVGLFGMMWLVPLFATSESPGFGLAPAVGVLVVMMVPHLALASADLLRLDLEASRQAAATLRIGLEFFILRIVWPAKRRSLANLVGFAWARALGETLALMMVSGNVIGWPKGLHTPVRTLNATIALEMPYAQGIHRASLFMLGLVTLALVWLCHTLAGRRTSCAG